VLDTGIQRKTRHTQIPGIASSTQATGISGIVFKPTFRPTTIPGFRQFRSRVSQAQPRLRGYPGSYFNPPSDRQQSQGFTNSDPGYRKLNPGYGDLRDGHFELYSCVAWMEPQQLCCAGISGIGFQPTFRPTTIQNPRISPIQIPGIAKYPGSVFNPPSDRQQAQIPGFRQFRSRVSQAQPRLRGYPGRALRTLFLCSLDGTEAALLRRDIQDHISTHLQPNNNPRISPTQIPGIASSTQAT